MSLSRRPAAGWDSPPYLGVHGEECRVLTNAATSAMTHSRSSLRLSVALVTRHRPDSLRRCLESLRAQDVQPWEVLVSDDSDHPGLVAENRAAARDWQCRYLTGPRRGLYANRNHAALACTGTHIRTVDDDHTFPRGHFGECLEGVAADPRAIWTTGETSFIDGRHYAVAETANQLHPSGLGTRVEDPDDNWAIADGSTIYPRAVFAAGYRLMEDFPFGSSYLEFGALLYQRGYRSRCQRGAKVEHHANWETIHRGDDLRVKCSHLFASLCFNLYFRRSLARALRYALGNLWSARFHPKLVLALPRCLLEARRRWVERH